jgi:hypothetical protein
MYYTFHDVDDRLIFSVTGYQFPAPFFFSLVKTLRLLYSLAFADGCALSSAYISSISFLKALAACGRLSFNLQPMRLVLAPTVYICMNI